MIELMPNIYSLAIQRVIHLLNQRSIKKVVVSIKGQEIVVDGSTTLTKWTSLFSNNVGTKPVCLYEPGKGDSFMQFNSPDPLIWRVVPRKPR